MAGKADRAAALARRGRRAALVLIGSALFWILSMALGAEYGWRQDVRLATDLLALVGMAVALGMTWTVWRARRGEKD